MKVQNSTASVTSGTGIQGGSTFHYVTVPNREIIAEVHPRKYGIKVERTNPVLLEERPDIVLTFRNIDGSYTGEALIELLEDIIDVLGVIEHEVSDDDDEDEDDFDDDEFEEEEEDELETEETPPPPSRSSEQADGGIFCTCHICRPAK